MQWREKFSIIEPTFCMKKKYIKTIRMTWFRQQHVHVNGLSPRDKWNYTVYNSSALTIEN